MICAITYGDERYKRAKRLNCKTAKKYGADKTIAYGPEEIDEDFKKENSIIWNEGRGGGYWIWKPYIILRTLEGLNDEDYLIYTDAGAVFVGEISKLIECMEKEKQDIMVFSLTHKECEWTKRDTFLLLECDKKIYAESMQILGGYIVLKKTEFARKILEEWLYWVQDVRAVTDCLIVLAKTITRGFIEHRHDQSILSLLCKKYEIKPFRDPSQFGVGNIQYSEKICDRSKYPQIIFSHRNGNIGSLFQLKYGDTEWYKFITWKYYRELLGKFRKIFK